ncbi:DNA polymerase II [Pseudoalteromonas sp. MMG007]|uniref:DNA polymerase II n=1 Tax=Pseudoalteromonas sp. MMG007 TaxID=2822684 RepID=UPI001B385845|nr:DNA polymerase II [Pseudoalteromonas sp. MMG007]
MYLTAGFIVSSHAYDTENGICYEAWFCSDNGPIKTVSTNERALFFVKSTDAERVSEILTAESLYFTIKNLPLKNFQQQSVSACYFSSLKHFYSAAKILKQYGVLLYEEDIRPIERYLMERFIKGGAWITGNAFTKNGYTLVTDAKLKANKAYSPTLNKLSLDIECNESGVLFSIGLVGCGLDCVLMIGEPNNNADKLDFDIVWCVDEAELLNRLEHYIQLSDPDVIVGWNVIEFDFAVIHERGEALGIKLMLGRAEQPLYVRKGNFTRVSIPGRCVIDGIDTLKNGTYSFESFSLANVSNDVLGESKLIESANSLQEIIRQFNEDKLSLAKYNRQDCILVNKIFDKLKLLDFAVIRTQLTGLELEKKGGSVAAFINMYLPLLHRSGYIAPNMGDHGLTFESPGGYVMESIPGLYKNVIVLDFKSLYPSIMQTFYIDPLGLIEGLKEPSESVQGFNDAAFSRDKHHLPLLIKSLAAQRQLAKDQKNSMLSQAIKIIMNSLYGVLGSKGCRFYDPRLSSSITLRGHEIMQQTKKWTEDLGYSVIYGDTDSTFVKLNDELTPDECNEVGKFLAEKINTAWKNEIRKTHNLTSHLEIEFESYYSPFFLPTIRGKSVGSKKRYVGKLIKPDESKLVFKGLETVRSDWTKLAQQFQFDLFTSLFDGNLNIEHLIKDYTTKLFKGEFDDLLTFKKRLGQNLIDYKKNIPPHVQAVKKHQKKNSEFVVNRGEFVTFVYTTTGVELYQGSHNYDYQIYMEKQIVPLFEMVSFALNLNVNILTGFQASLPI